jgi:alcohol dehydrogenase class IV
MAQINYITQVQFDHGAIQLLASECARLKIQKPLLVTDKGVRAAGLMDRVLPHLTDFVVQIFDAVPTNPTEAAVRAGMDAARKHGCDGLIALGGGSVIDCAKGIAILLGQDLPLKTFATIEGGSLKISEQTPPVIAIPTTAGTGSEVARGAILIVEDGRKLGFHSWYLVPKAAICDPELTLGLPPMLTAATGMDAVAHCMETFMSAAFNPPADGIALDGLARAWAHIERAVANGQDKEARFHMMSASMQGAMAFQKGLGCVHSLSHSLGGVNPRLHHGTLNAMFLPAVVRFNAQTQSMRSEKRLERMAHAMGLSNPADVADALTDMTRRLKLPQGLKAMGVVESDFDAVLPGTLADHCHKTNPRLASSDDYRQIWTESLVL